MKIYRSVKRNLLTQGFGLANTVPSLLPKYQSFGLKSHNGVDWSTESGDDVRFNTDGKGKVIEVSIDSAGGLGVVVMFCADGKSWKTYYWHLKEFRVKVGEIIKIGDLIGLADNTGWSTGNHLHFGLKECDKNGETLDYDNGMLGAIDPTPYFQNIYVLDLIIELQGKIIVLLKLAIETIRKILALKIK